MAVKLLRGRQSVTSCRGVKSKARIVHTGVPQGSKMSPDKPRPTEPVKRICYADDIPVWATVVKLPELERKINDYLTGSHKMSSIDHLHSETKMLLV